MKFFTNGLVLKKQKYKEKDRIVTILTSGNGVIRAFVRGAEDIKNPKCASTDILCYSRFTMSESKETYYINEAKAIEQFPGLRDSIENVSLAQYFCELFINLSPKEAHAEEYLKLLSNALYLLANNKKSPLLVKACVELRLMTLCGYMPDLVMCSECGNYETNTMTFIPQTGKLLCDICTKELEAKGILMSKAVVTALRHIALSDFEKLFSFNLGDESLKVLNEATEKYVEYMTDRKYKTLDFYKTLIEN